MKKNDIIRMLNGREQAIQTRLFEIRMMDNTDITGVTLIEFAALERELANVRQAVACMADIAID